MKFIVIIGTWCRGISTIHGPFEDKESASKWASLNVSIGESYEICRMEAR